MFYLGFGAFGPDPVSSGTTFRPRQLLWDDFCCRTTFRTILLFREEISTYPAAPGRHLDLSAPGRYFDLYGCFGTTFRLILLLRDDILTYLLWDTATL